MGTCRGQNLLRFSVLMFVHNFTLCEHGRFEVSYRITTSAAAATRNILHKLQYNGGNVRKEL